MSEPLGFTIGNALEVKEAINTLKGNGPADLTELCLELGSHMLVLGETAKTQGEAVEILKRLIDSGAAFNKFKELVEAQGGDTKVVDNTDLLPDTQFSETYKSKKEGYISELNALDIGLASVKLGAGRETKASVIDFGAGIVLKKKIGDYIKKDEVLAILYSNNSANFTKAEEFMDKAYKISEEKPSHKPLILKTITK
jgi:pyrimidine-nucleoside phosphorylase